MSRMRYLYFGAALLAIGLTSAVVIARRHYWDWSQIPFLYSVHLRAFGARTACEVHRLLAGVSAPPYQCAVAAAKSEYAAMGFTYEDGIQQYTPFGDWLNCGTRCTWQAGSKFQFDREGIPVVNYGEGKYEYNPVTIAQYGLAMYGRYLRGNSEAQPQFMRAVHKLLAIQDSRGALPYAFSLCCTPDGNEYRPGWISGMAQGEALSLFARAYYLTGDLRYLQAGDLAFDVLITPIAEDGALGTLAAVIPGDTQHIVFEEYPSNPPAYTLNGFMFAMLGVYDWSHVPSPRASEAGEYFQKSLQSLRLLLPYYDLGGFTSYDLEQVTYHKKPHIGVNYHAVHIYELHALVSITGDPVLAQYERLWASYVPH